MKPAILILVVVLAPLVGLAQWTAHPVTMEGDGAVDGYAADFDNDGDLDVVGACVIEWTASWWENTDGAGTEWEEHVLPGTIYGIMCSSAADLNGDGDLDILSAFSVDENIRWWENGGDGAGWTLRTVAVSFEDAQSVCAADVDGDGDLDVIGSGGASVRWWENDGTGAGWTEHVIAANVNWGHHVNVADVNGDGDLDVLGIAMMGDDVYWCENMDGNGTSWTPHMVDGSYNGAIHVEAADFDGDGFLDLATCAAGANAVTWWRNTDGSGTSWTEHTVDSIQGPSYLAVDDFDQDGDPDIACAATTNDGRDVVWWENGGGGWAEHVVQADFESASSVRAVDFNGDGMPDMIGSSYATDTINWWVNEGGAPDPVVLDLTPTAPTSIPAAGGTLVYTAHLVSTLPNPVTGLRYWTDVILPNGAPYGPTYGVNFTMPAFCDMTVPGMTQVVPAMAPAGNYTFRGFVGFTAGPRVSDTFPFAKLEAAVYDNGEVNDGPVSWGGGGKFAPANGVAGVPADPAGGAAGLPKGFALTGVWPNPFNGAATVTVDLPQVSELTVVVFNVAGQRVAELARGPMSAGSHEFALDGSALASGVYLVRAVVPGELDAVKKAVLVK